MPPLVSLYLPCLSPGAPCGTMGKQLGRERSDSTRGTRVSTGSVYRQIGHDKDTSGVFLAMTHYKGILVYVSDLILLDDLCRQTGSVRVQ